MSESESIEIKYPSEFSWLRLHAGDVLRIEGTGENVEVVAASTPVLDDENYAHQDLEVYRA